MKFSDLPQPYIGVKAYVPERFFTDGYFKGCTGTIIKAYQPRTGSGIVVLTFDDRTMATHPKLKNRLHTSTGGDGKVYDHAYLGYIEEIEINGIATFKDISENDFDNMF